MVCVHGIQSHGGWYVHSCRRLADAGYEVFFLDRRGSGLNTQDRGDAPGFRRLLRDVAEFLHRVKEEDAARKTYVVGISWGGKTAVGVEKYRPGLMDGIALLCPGFCPRVGLSRRERWAVAWARLTAPERTFPVPLSDPALFTASEKWQTFLRDDPLSLHDATARLLFASAMLDIYLRNVGRRMRLPVLMLLAGRDRIIDNPRTREFVGRFAGPKEVVEYPEAHHTLEFEPDPDRHVNDLIRWIQVRSARTPPQRGTGRFVRPGLTPTTRGRSPVRRIRKRTP